MTSWTMVLSLALISLSMEYTVAYQIFNYNRDVRPYEPLPILTKMRSMLRPYCLIKNEWVDCSVAREMFLKESFGTSHTDIERQNRYKVNRLLKSEEPVKLTQINYLQSKRPIVKLPYLNFPKKRKTLNHRKKPMSKQSNSKSNQSVSSPYNLISNVSPKGTDDVVSKTMTTSPKHPVEFRRKLGKIKDTSENSYSDSSKESFDTIGDGYETHLDDNSIDELTVYSTPGSNMFETVKYGDFKPTAFEETEDANKAYVSTNIDPLTNTEKYNWYDIITTVTPHYNFGQSESTFQKDTSGLPSADQQAILSVKSESNFMITVNNALNTITSNDVINEKELNQGLALITTNNETFNGMQDSILHSNKVTEAESSYNLTNKQVQVTYNTVQIDEELDRGGLHFREADEQRKKELLYNFTDILDNVERDFLCITFNKLTSISPAKRRDNGISFAQSGLFLSLLLMALSTETNDEAKAEIDQSLGLNVTDMEKIDLIEDVIANLPPSSEELKYRWASRLVLGPSQNLTHEFECGAAAALRLLPGKTYGNKTDEDLAETLNHMVEQDSGGAIHNTFDPEEVSGGVRAVALTTLYLRARWRSAPTVLNGSRPFYDAEGAAPRATRMIRVNDLMRYANLTDFHALEIPYSTPGLSLLMLVPHGRSLRPLAERLRSESLREITQRLQNMRVAATMPLYTLRMTLLLPSKLEAMGITKLMSSNNGTDDGRLKLSHAVQRLMFWSEAGRNAFKDDDFLKTDPKKNG